MTNHKTKRWSLFLLGLALVISIFFHFFRLGHGEFIGEDEASVMIKVARQFLWRQDIRNLALNDTLLLCESLETERQEQRDRERETVKELLNLHD